MLTPIHHRVSRLRHGELDPQLIARLPTGWAILGDKQPEPIVGCCTLLCDIEDRLLDIACSDGSPPSGAGSTVIDAEQDGLRLRHTPAHLTDLPLSPIDLQSAFLGDVARLARAVTDATGCERVNILLLCNQVQALHAHVVPRYASEDPAKRPLDPFCAYDFAMSPPADAQNNPRHERILDALRAAITL